MWNSKTLSKPKVFELAWNSTINIKPKIPKKKKKKKPYDPYNKRETQKP